MVQTSGWELRVTPLIYFLTKRITMDDGKRILNWIKENGHTVDAVAEKLGFSRQAVSSALNQNRISVQLADALYEHFWLKVTVTAPADDTEASVERRGRPHGSVKTPRPSKLDAVADEIEKLLNRGETQRNIATRYSTTDSNLHNWMKKRGLKRPKGDQLG